MANAQAIAVFASRHRSLRASPTRRPLGTSRVRRAVDLLVVRPSVHCISEFTEFTLHSYCASNSRIMHAFTNAYPCIPHLGW